MKRGFRIASVITVLDSDVPVLQKAETRHGSRLTALSSLGTGGVALRLVGLHLGLPFSFPPTSDHLPIGPTQQFWTA